MKLATGASGFTAGCRLLVVAVLAGAVGGCGSRDEEPLMADEQPSASDRTAILTAELESFQFTLERSRGALEQVAALDAGNEAATALGEEWQVSILSLEHGEMEASLGDLVSRGGSRVGEAWDMAYELEARPGVVNAEPTFTLIEEPEAQARGAEDETAECIGGAEVGPLSRGGSGHLRGAMEDTEWALGENGLNLKAWLSDPEQAAGGGSGELILIGHPDTGYRPHPEIWTPATDPPILADLGRSFLKGETSPEDLLSDRFLQNPGHGTGTSSVMVSPTGNQLGGSTLGMVSGVAPAARVIPYRVTPTVILLNSCKIAPAIDAAVSQGAKVVSMSLGGLPCRRLRRSIEDAIEAGVVVLAAAGNKVRIVTWPARYDQVIALAASNVESENWSGTSRGRSVDVAAPGESVWRATTKRTDDGDLLDCVGPSSGTSYAVALTAGLAARWLDHHRDEVAQLEAAGISPQEAYRCLLTRTARIPDGWNSKKFGAGIVDANSLLEADLLGDGLWDECASAAPAVARGVSTPCDEDLENLESIFEEADDSRQRIAELLRMPVGGKLCDVAQVGDEVVFHLVRDESVLSAFEGITGPEEPTADAYDAARKALLETDISERLRSVLTER